LCIKLNCFQGSNITIDILYKKIIEFCRVGWYLEAQILYKNNITIRDINYTFLGCCENGHLATAKWLYSLGGVNIHADNIV